MKHIILLVLILQTFSFAEWYDGMNNAYDNVKKSISSKELTVEEKKEKKFRILWEDVFEEYKEGLILLDEAKGAPSSAWFKKDKIDYKGDIDHVINNIIKILIDDDLLSYKDKIEENKNEIIELKTKRSEFLEKKTYAPIESRIYTTQANYKEKIKDVNDEINILKGNIETIKIGLQKRFKNNGINLSVSNINQLVSRVYGDDIIQMTVIFELLNKITNQFGALMDESRENLEESKKYYGMHLVSLQLVVHIQQKYMDKVDRYVNQVESIVNKIEQMIQDTNRAYEIEDDNDLKLGYLNNQRIQQFNYEVSIRYKEDLLSSKNEILSAQKVILSQLKLAENTYQTVSLSSQLYTLMADSKMLFNRISKIQVPQLKAFETKKIKSKYEEITNKLLRLE